MNVLLVALGSAGDVYPLVSLGLALRARGHHVSLLANGYFEPIAHRVGLAFHEIAPAADYHMVVEKGELWRPIPGFKLVMEWLALRPMRRTFAVIRELSIPGETVIVAPMTAFGTDRAGTSADSARYGLRAAEHPSKSQPATDCEAASRISQAAARLEPGLALACGSHSRRSARQDRDRRISRRAELGAGPARLCRLVVVAVANSRSVSGLVRLTSGGLATAGSPE